MPGVQSGIDIDLRNLEYVRGSGLNRAIRIALNKASVPVKAAVQSSAPQKTGFLRAAMRIKTQFRKGVWASIVGPSSAVKKLRKRKKVKTAGSTRGTSSSTPKARARRRKTKLGRLIARSVTVGKKRIKRARKVAAKKAKAVRKSFLKSKLVKSLKKKFKKKPGANDYLRPSRYGSILQFGSKKLHARHYLERAYAKSSGVFTATLTSKLKEQLAAMMPRK